MLNFRLLLTFSAWKDQGNQNVLAKYTMDALGWQYDPTNPLGKAVEGLSTYNMMDALDYKP